VLLQNATPSPAMPPSDLPPHRRAKKLGVRFLCVVAPAAYRAWMRLVRATSHWDDSAVRHLSARKDAGEGIVLVMLHQDVAIAPWFLRGLEVCGLASIGDAGDVIDAVMRSLGHRNVRGGSSARASRHRPLSALRELIRRGRERRGRGFVLAITPDGSTGPAGACKPGFALVALETGASVWVLKMHSSRALFAPTWDRTLVPLPFGRVRGHLEGPFQVAPRSNAAQLEAIRQEVEQALHRVHARAFAEGGQQPAPVLARFAD
jgi:lysophospholipid acyltransferase (LPLAT)-like uncharacterized protein